MPLEDLPEAIRRGILDFGLGRRPELADGILSILDRVDIIEVIAKDFFDSSSCQSGRAWDLLGLASTVPPRRKRLDKMAPRRKNRA